MSTLPAELKYNASHEWVRDNEDGTITVGITDHAQAMLGDLVHIELPDVDAEFEFQDGAAVAESVKAASDIYAPLAGIITEVNESLLDSPELINSDPYGEGWLFTMKMEDADMLETLMDAETYQSQLEDE